ncbi:MAG: poly(beta-D-mannuronate) lyase, partial [Halomonadaceae bacterium]|nr:poly(beta-D-mannuronate) lyase [Halomonadaceae bacterium]
MCRLLTVALLATTSISIGADTLSREERMELDLSAYRVTDTDAGYFDVEARMAL